MGRKRIRDEDDQSESRAAETRQTEARLSDERELLSDDQESPLYIPRSEWPDGKTLRWVRIESAGAADNKNWSQMTRVGWSPVERSRYAKRFPLVNMPGQGDITDGKIIFGGLCLCERDTRLVERDRARQMAETAARNESISEYVEGGRGDPNFQRVDFGTGKVQYARAAFKE